MSAMSSLRFVFVLRMQLLVVNSLSFQCVAPSTIADLTMQTIFCDVQVTLNDPIANHWRHPQILIDQCLTNNTTSVYRKLPTSLGKPPCNYPPSRRSVGLTECVASLMTVNQKKDITNHPRETFLSLNGASSRKQQQKLPAIYCPCKLFVSLFVKHLRFSFKVFRFWCHQLQFKPRFPPP